MNIINKNLLCSWTCDLNEVGYSNSLIKKSAQYLRKSAVTDTLCPCMFITVCEIDLHSIRA